jgi:HPt (histidine-containing phosphotransfer) domain-containing protein
MAARAETVSVAVAEPDLPAPVPDATINMKFIDQLRELDPVGGMGLARQIMRAYLDTTGKLVSQAEQAIATVDADALRFAAHSLKSSSANVGAQTLSGLFKDLEGMAREVRLDEARILFDAVRQEYAQAVKEIGTLLEETE